MKIAIISSYGVYCGIARYTYYLAKELSLLGHDLMIFARYKLENESYERKKRNLKFLRCWSNEKGTSLKKLLKNLKKFNPEIIHIQDIFRRDDGIKEIQRLFPKKVIITLHSVNAPKATFHGVEKISDVTFVNLIKNNVDHFIVHSQLCKNALSQTSKIKKNKISVIHHGSLLFEKEISKKEARKKLKLPEKKTIILTYGFFHPRKGVIQIIESLPQLLKKIPNIFYLHLGRKRLTGEDKYLQVFKELKEKIKKEGLQKHTKFIWKYLPENVVEIYLKAADLLLLFYPEEWPLCHASGIAHTFVGSKRPIIASDVSTFAEFPKEAMYKIPYRKSSLISAIQKVLKNEKLQKKLIQKSFAYAKKTCWSNIAREHLKLYQKLLIASS